MGELIIKTTIAALYGSGSNGVKMPLGIESIGAIWFLFALLWAMLIVKFSIRYKYGIGIILIIAILSYCSSIYIWLPFSIQAGGVASAFVYLGYYIKKKKLIEEKTNWIVVISGIISLIVQVRYDFALYMASNHYSHGFANIIVAILLSYIVIVISKYIDKIKFIRRILSFYGENSLLILCFHIIELNNFPWSYVYDILESFGVSLTIAHICVILGKITFSTLCTYIALKINLVRYIFGKEEINKARVLEP